MNYLYLCDDLWCAIHTGMVLGIQISWPCWQDFIQVSRVWLYSRYTEIRFKDNDENYVLDVSQEFQLCQVRRVVDAIFSEFIFQT